MRDLTDAPDEEVAAERAKVATGRVEVEAGNGGDTLLGLCRYGGEGKREEQEEEPAFHVVYSNRSASAGFTVEARRAGMSAAPNVAEHHRLHADARDNKNRVDVSAWSAGDRAAWTNALEVYDRDLAQRDLRTGRDMTMISGRLSGARDSLASLGLADDHRRALEAVAPVYRKHRWPQDDKANRAWIGDVAGRLERIRARVVPQLEAFYRTPWYSEKKMARVDIVFVGNARGGYTWIYPEVHSVIDAADATYQGWLGVEMTLHEASHGLISRLEEALATAGRAANKDAGALWHPVQFFVVGEILKHTLAADGVTFTSYLYETGLFDRAWPRYKGPIETVIRGWLDKRFEWDEAIAKLVAAI